MSPRKKWRLRLIPSFTYQTASSMKRAYERTMEFQDAYRAGFSNIHRVDIQVDEGLGRGWELFEICEFPERAA